MAEMKGDDPYGVAPDLFFYGLVLSGFLLVLGIFSWKFIAVGATIAIVIGLKMIATTIEEGARRQ